MAKLFPIFPAGHAGAGQNHECENDATASASAPPNYKLCPITARLLGVLVGQGTPAALFCGCMPAYEAGQVGVPSVKSVTQVNGQTVSRVSIGGFNTIYLVLVRQGDQVLLDDDLCDATKPTTSIQKGLQLCK